ncbi:uncharacterized protein LOC111035455 [Myzus persicae]|uniref:uncharacterized protein LOC111035455 n=1 Tax=Myzus persicae TaxID=13164 RepID=UPI000B93779D|nr:uncharacterized protein LOC111035455 [Myzus persicae]XP_022172778.1 uncharacterized protein LOC111035455 [Myzus persicae]
MKEVLLVALLSVVWSLRPIGTADVVQTKTAAPAPEARTNDDDNQSLQSASVSDGGDVNNGTSPCDRYLRSAEVEVRNPRNHKFVTSNGWAERQRPRPEISVYSRVEELPSPQPPAATAGAAYYHQQRDSSFYQHSRQQPAALQRTSKRIIYYATLPDVIRPPAGYPPPSNPYSADPFALGPGPFSADFRQLQDSSRKSPADGLQRSRLTSYENAYNRGGGGGQGGGGVSVGGNGVTSVTTKSTALYNSRYDEPAEFRDSYYRPNELTSKFASWAEPFYKSWSSSSWDKDRASFSNNNRGSPSFSWDREPLNRGGGSWDREPLNRGGGSWDREPLGGDGGNSWDNRGSSWDNRGSSWDKDLVEVPLQKPYRSGGGGGGRDNNLYNNDKYPEVAVVHSGVIDVRGDRQQNGSPPLAPPPRFTIIDVDPKPYHDQQPITMRYDERSKPMVQQNMRYEPPQKPMRYEEYMPMHTRIEQQQPMPPSSMRYEQQYRSPQQQHQQSSTRYGQQQQTQNKPPSNGYYESIKNNINTHQFMTSWTEVSTQDEVSPTPSVSIDIATTGNSTSVQNNTKITPNANTSKIPK